MDDRYEDVIKQYDIKVFHTYRARGAFVLDTNLGLKLYRAYEGSESRAKFDNTVKVQIKDKGFENVDTYLVNNKEELVTKDPMGNRYVVKDWFSGEECNLRELRSIVKASANLAKLHEKMQKIELVEEEKNYQSYNTLTELFDKRNRELKRVKRYIGDKKQKNEFEICFLNSYQEFYNQGIEAFDLLEKSEYKKLLEKAILENNICHGNYTYHNVLMLEEGIATTNFEKAYIDIQMIDLYQFIRKVMEKNEWDYNLGILIIEEYNKYNLLTTQEMKIIYVLLLFPEKFWKITNFYYNSKKSWVPRRNIQKLISIREQSTLKTEFLKKLASEYGV